MLDIVASYHCMQSQGKLKNQPWENGKKPSFETNFGPFRPNPEWWYARHMPFWYFTTEAI